MSLLLPASNPPAAVKIPAFVRVVLATQEPEVKDSTVRSPLSAASIFQESGLSSAASEIMLIVDTAPVNPWTVKAVVIVGEMLKTDKAPALLPVSFYKTPKSCALVVDAKNPRLLADNPTVPVKSGKVIVLSGVVGSVTVRVSWKSLSVAPSKLIDVPKYPVSK